jgi:hypothetical protein
LEEALKLFRNCSWLGTDHLIFHWEGGAQIRKKYRACLELKKKKIEHQHHQKKYRAQKISKLERKILQPDFWL